MAEIFIKVFAFLIPPMIVNGSFNFLYPLRVKSLTFAKLDQPIDFRKNFIDGKRFIGESATFPGIIVAVIVGPIVGYLFYKSWILGFVIGICTYLGHTIGSFIKRRANVADGKFLPIIDHSDYIIFNGLVWLALGLLTFKIFIISWVTILIIHPIFCYIGYKMKIRAEIL